MGSTDDITSPATECFSGCGRHPELDLCLTPMSDNHLGAPEPPPKKDTASHVLHQGRVRDG